MGNEGWEADMTHTMSTKLQTNTTQPHLERNGRRAVFRASGALTDSGPEFDTWIDYARHSIKEAFALESDWDREGAPEVSLESAETAEMLAVDLVGQGVQRPLISASRDGGITFDWISPALELSLVAIQGQVVGHVFYVRDKSEVEGPVEEILPEVYDALFEFRA